MSERGLISCANKKSTANLDFQGRGVIDLELRNGKKVELKDVIYAKDLAKNLLSLRKFVDQGLKIYLDNKCINIFDPVTRETVISGLYKKPFWEIEIKLNRGHLDNSNSSNKRIFVNLATRSGKIIEQAEKKVVKVNQQTGVKEVKVTENKSLNSTVNNRRIENADCLTMENVNGSIQLKSDKKDKLNTILLWHARLGHMSIPYMQKFKKLYPELKDFESSDFDESVRECDVCFRAKMNKLPFTKIRHRETEPLLKFHADVMGYISPVTYPSQYRFIVAFVDSYSRYAGTYPLKHKSEVPNCLREFLMSVRNLIGKDVKICYMECDQGTEFTNKETIKVLCEFGAQLKTVCPGTPEHNGVVERFNQTIQKKVRALLLDSGLPSNMWDIALGVATYLYNLSPHKSLGMQSPLNLIAPNHKFDINQLKRFGCLTYIKIQNTTKFGPLALKTYLVGYLSTGYIVYHPETKKLIETRNVRFVERFVYGDIHKAKIEELTISRVDPRTNIPTLTSQPSTQNEGAKKQTESSESEGESAQPQIKRKRGRPRKVQVEKTILYASLTGEKNDEFDCEYFALLTKISGDPKNYREAMSRHDSVEWQEAVNAELEAMTVNKVFRIVERPKTDSKGRKPNILSTRWVFKEKIDSEGNRLKKARLVTRGFQDKNFYDLHETYAPVTRLSLVRAVLAFANKHNLTMFQLDVKTAFLNSTVLEEIYIEIPDGIAYTDEEKRSKVCKLEKSLYGLKTSPKRWYETFFETMKELGFTTNENDPCLFTLRSGEVVILALLYVDDIILTGNHETSLRKYKTELLKRFRMKDLGEPKEYLGITIMRDRTARTLKLNQTKFIEQMIKKFGYEDAFPQKSPMMTNQVLNRERRAREGEPRNANVVSPTPFREAIGSLLYLANATRPDISYAVNILSRHQLNPTEVEWKMLDRVFRYLIHTKSLSLTYRGELEGVDAYSDASLADCKGSITTCGYLVRLYGDIITWKTQKQHYVALSTCQAEYIAMSEACKEMIALGFSLEGFVSGNFYPMTLKCDNNSAIKCTQIQGAVGLRHLTEVRYHFVKECANRGRIIVEWVASKDQLADIFTKPLSYVLHDNLTNRIFNLN